MKTLFILLSIFSLPLHAEVHGTKIEIAHNSSQRLISIKGVLLNGVQWNTATIKKELSRVNHIFSQCKIQIKEVELLTSKTSPNFSSINQLASLGAELEKIGFKSRKEVVMVFAGKITGELREEGGSQTGGFSINKSNLTAAEKEDMPMENMSVLLDYGHTKDYQKTRIPEYTPVAHELIHIYLNTGHTYFKNLMASSASMVTAELTAEQCEEFNKSSLLK